jgi:tetratricopeptide (TPR) repeat protein
MTSPKQNGWRSPRGVARALALAAILVAAAAYSVASPRSSPPAVPAITVPDANGNLTPAQQLWQNLNDAEKNGRYDDALAFAKLLRGQYGELYLVNLRSGWLFYLKKDYTSSLEAYRRASVQAPGSASALQGMASCYVELGYTEQAIQTSNALLAVIPMNYQANRRLADLYFQVKNYSRAEVLYLKLSNMYPEDLDVAAQLAWCYFSQGRGDAAQAIFQSVLIVAPNHASAQVGLNSCQTSGKGGS